VDMCADRQTIRAAELNTYQHEMLRPSRDMKYVLVFSIQ